MINPFKIKSCINVFLIILKYTASVYLALGFGQVYGQRCVILSTSQVNSVFTDSIKAAFKLSYRIQRVYNYQDKTGEYYCALTESTDSIGNYNKDTFNHSIRAINFKVNANRLEKTWELNDFIVRNSFENESSIWFWTRYCAFEDFDNDGIVEPIIVYGTTGVYDDDNNRIKFIIYYNGQKIAIRHQNCVVDNGRNTQVDNSFYSLPKKLKDFIQAEMNIMIKEYGAIFTAKF